MYYFLTHMPKIRYHYNKKSTAGKPRCGFFVQLYCGDYNTTDISGNGFAGLAGSPAMRDTLFMLG